MVEGMVEGFVKVYCAVHIPCSLKLKLQMRCSRNVPVLRAKKFFFIMDYKFKLSEWSTFYVPSFAT